MPDARATAFIAPALVALIASIPSRPSSSIRSTTPQTKAPCAPPPWRARFTFFDGLLLTLANFGCRGPKPYYTDDPPQFDTLKFRAHVWECAIQKGGATPQGVG